MRRVQEERGDDNTVSARRPHRGVRVVGPLEIGAIARPSFGGVHEFPTSPGEIDAVPWTRIDTHLGHTGGHHPYIAGITCCEPLDARLDPRPTLQIAKAIEPGGEDIGLEYPHL